MQKTWEYQTINYEFRSWEHMGDKVYIATDKETLTVDEDMLDMFLAGLIEVGAKKNGHEVSSEVVAYKPIVLTTMTPDTQTSIVDGLRGAFDELSNAQTPEKIKALSLKASNMVKITQAMTGMARLELDLHKQASAKKSNKS